MTWRTAPLTLAGLMALGAINAWLIAELAAAFVGEDRSSAAQIELSPKVSTAADGLPSAKAITAYDQTLAHPLFFKTREPFVARPPAQPPPPPRPVLAPPTDPGLVVGGIMINGGNRKAYLFRKADSNGTWVREGDEFMGWKVQSISAGMTLLQKDDRTIELQLYAQR